jgi:hypothetical protein
MINCDVNGSRPAVRGQLFENQRFNGKMTLASPVLWQFRRAECDFAHARGEFAVLSAKSIDLENVVTYNR